MAKRFTDTDKWKDAWFTELEPSMKIFWIYICDNCDHAGIWRVNFKLAVATIGNIILDKPSALKAFGDRIKVISDDKWFIIKFITFQYPKGLNAKNSAHRGVLRLLESNTIDQSPYLAPQDKDKVMDKGIVSISSSLRMSGAPKPDQIIHLFNETLAATQTGKIKFCAGLSADQSEKLLITLSHKTFQSLETWKLIFENVKQSDWLIGLSSNFVVTLNWLADHGNALKVLNGQYNGALKPSNRGKVSVSGGNPYLRELEEKYGKEGA